MLHTNQADVPQSKGSQWAMWVQDDSASPTAATR